MNGPLHSIMDAKPKEYRNMNLPPPPRVYAHKEEPGKPFRPSNGQDGRVFADWFCNRCVHDHAAHNGDFENGCRIYSAAIFNNPGDDGYPSEWVIADDGYPACTAYEKEPSCPD